MELQTISQVSKNYGISTNTLRYYEQIGLIKSIRKEDNAYRFYDEAAVKQLSFIILLRKLRISVKQIKEIINNQNALKTVEIFERNISELDEEITSLSTIKSILAQFADELRTKSGMVLDLLNGTNTLSIIDSVSFSKNYINNVKENLSMEDLNKANETLEKLEEKKSSEIIIPLEKPVDNNPVALEKLAIVKCGPYRFIGKSVLARGHNQKGTADIFRSLWHSGDWIFKELDNLKDYASDKVYNSALMTWEKYDEKTQLKTYTVGRFMQADTPVPEEMDFFDIPEMYVAEGWARDTRNNDYFGDALGEDLFWNEIERQGGFKPNIGKLAAEFYPEPPTSGVYGYYCACSKRDE